MGRSIGNKDANIHKVNENEYILHDFDSKNKSVYLKMTKVEIFKNRWFKNKYKT